MGVGYWVWLIPLGSGSTSVGIVVDATLHPYGRLNRFDRALDWLREFEPQCAEVVASHEADLEDFLALRGFAYGCSRVYSPDRWALIGEAGLFTDPFYSPGSDFIAMGNDYVVDLIRRERSGEDVSARVEQYNTTYLRLYDAFLRLYQGQYPIMGNAQVMTAKVAWDNACYWAITALLYFQRKYRQPEFIASIDDLMRRFFVLHARMQQFLKAWNDIDARNYGAGFTSVVDARLAAAAAGRARRAAVGGRCASGAAARELRAARAVRARPAGHRAHRARGAAGAEPVSAAARRPGRERDEIDIEPLRVHSRVAASTEVRVMNYVNPPDPRSWSEFRDLTPTPPAARAPSRCRRTRATWRPRSAPALPWPRWPPRPRHTPDRFRCGAASEGSRRARW